MIKYHAGRVGSLHLFLALISHNLDFKLILCSSDINYNLYLVCGLVLCCCDHTIFQLISPYIVDIHILMSERESLPMIIRLRVFSNVMSCGKYVLLMLYHMV